MRKIYKLCIGIALSAIIVACADKLDSDKYFKDRRSLEDVFTDKENTEEWLETKTPRKDVLRGA